VALRLAVAGMVKSGVLSAIPLSDSVAAVSCGLVKGAPVLDLDYGEDSGADADANFVLTGQGRIVEVQATAEGAVFGDAELAAMLALARKGIGELTQLQRQAAGL
jgi:ribonuclease PH